jgi:hypothetical protein
MCASFYANDSNLSISRTVISIDVFPSAERHLNDQGTGSITSTIYRGEEAWFDEAVHLT